MCQDLVPVVSPNKYTHKETPLKQALPNTDCAHLISPSRDGGKVFREGWGFWWVLAKNKSSPIKHQTGGGGGLEIFVPIQSLYKTLSFSEVSACLQVTLGFLQSNENSLSEWDWLLRKIFLENRCETWLFIIQSCVNVLTCTESNQGLVMHISPKSLKTYFILGILCAYFQLFLWP